MNLWMEFFSSAVHVCTVEDVSFDLLEQKDEGLPSDGNRNREKNSNGVRTSVGTKDFFLYISVNNRALGGRVIKCSTFTAAMQVRTPPVALTASYCNSV